MEDFGVGRKTGVRVDGKRHWRIGLFVTSHGV